MASGGGGIVTEEQVQKGCVWVNEVNKSIFDTAYEEIVAYFGGITFHGRTYRNIGYDWIEYMAQLDDNCALSIGLRDLDCVPGTLPDIILNNMTFK